jgi:hypothetical protein
MQTGILSLCGVLAGLFMVAMPAGAGIAGKIVDAEIGSSALSGNRVGVDPRRRIKVYLPAGYERGSARYPVIYYIHNMHWSADRLFTENHLHEFFERAVEGWRETFPHPAVSTSSAMTRWPGAG